MIWKDGRAKFEARRMARYQRRANWHRRFAWLPTMLDDPPSHSVWLAFYEARAVQGYNHTFWHRRAIGSAYN